MISRTATVQNKERTDGNMMACFREDKKVQLVNKCARMDAYTRAASRPIFSMATASWLTQWARRRIRASGRMVRCMEVASTRGPMAVAIKANTSMIRSMASECTCGPTAAVITACGRMVLNTARAPRYNPIWRCEKPSGKRARSRANCSFWMPNAKKSRNLLKKCKESAWRLAKAAVALTPRISKQRGRHHANKGHVSARAQSANPCKT